MTTTSIATRLNYFKSARKFVPVDLARYTVLTNWGEDYFSSLKDAKKWAQIAERASSYVEAHQQFVDFKKLSA